MVEIRLILFGNDAKFLSAYLGIAWCSVYTFRNNSLAVYTITGILNYVYTIFRNTIYVIRKTVSTLDSARKWNGFRRRAERIPLACGICSVA